MSLSADSDHNRFPRSGESSFELPPRELFRRIQKRDGRIVDFDRRKITEAIWAAARSVGGEDRATAELLTDRVIIYLGQLYDDHLLTIEEVQDAVEKVLIEQGHARTGKAFILYREERARERNLRGEGRSAPTQPTLFRESLIRVRTSGDEPVRWDRKRIVEALLRETSLPAKFAETISREVEKEIIHGGMRAVTAPLIREMVSCKLLEHGLETERRQYTRLGMPLADVERLLGGHGDPAGRRRPTPRADDRALAGELQRQFAFLSLFPAEVADAYLGGEIFVHHVDRIGSLYHGAHSVEYVRRFGLDFPGLSCRQNPPEDLDRLLEQVSRLTAVLREHFLSGVAWPWFNLFLSPVSREMPRESIERLLRRFLFDLGDRPEGPAGPPVFLDLALRSMEPPPGGRGWIRETDITGMLLESFARGDDRGQPFPLVEPRVYVGEEAWREEGADAFWDAVLFALSRKVTLTILFQRGKSLHLPECARLTPGTEKLDRRDLAHPWKMRYASWSKVSLNLPRVVLSCAGNEAELEENLGRVFQTVAAATQRKRAYCERLLHRGPRGPMGFLGVRLDGEPYLRRTCVLVGLYGLTEAARILAGDPSAEDPGIRRIEGKIIEHLYLLCRKFGQQNGVPAVLADESSPEAVAHFQRLQGHEVGGPPEAADDRQLRLFAEATRAWDRATDVGNRILRRGIFHDFMEGGAVIPVPWDDIPQDARNFRGLLHRCYRDTRALGIRIETPLTVCEDCGGRSRGRHDLCPVCRSANVR